MHLLPSGVQVRHVTEALACGGNATGSQGRDYVCQGTNQAYSTILLPYPTEAGMRGAYVEVHCRLVCIRHRWKHLQPGAAAG